MKFDNQPLRHYDEDFLWPRSRNWEIMKTPIMERAAQILAEKMLIMQGLITKLKIKGRLYAGVLKRRQIYTCKYDRDMARWKNQR